MQDAAFDAAGIEARYEAWDVPPAALPEAVAALRRADVLGANVTVPHKRSVMTHLDLLTERARAIGSVNVVERRDEGLRGDNSDAEGFLRSLEEAGLDPGGRTVVLIGAGGAARAVGWALLQAGVRELTIVNRTVPTAEDLANVLRPWAPEGAGVRALGLDAVPAVARGAWWINATSVGMIRGGVDPDVSPVPASVWSAAAYPTSREVPRLAIDLVYRPRVTRLLRDARAAGVRTLSGEGMLLHQGAVAFETWTGRPAPLAAMRAALDAGLAGEDGP